MQPEDGGNTKGETGSPGIDGRAHPHHSTAEGVGEGGGFQGGTQPGKLETDLSSGRIQGLVSVPSGFLYFLNFLQL